MECGLFHLRNSAGYVSEQQNTGYIRKKNQLKITIRNIDYSRKKIYVFYDSCL